MPRRFARCWALFSLESLEKVAEALAESDSRRMLEVVEELERNGQNLQHFCRELSRYFRNLLVARIAGARNAADRRVGGAARRSWSEIAARFCEEDLTRYLQLSLDLFRTAGFAPAAAASGDRAGAAGPRRPAAADRAGARGMKLRAPARGPELRHARRAAAPVAALPRARLGPGRRRSSSTPRRKRAPPPPAPAAPPSHAAAPMAAGDWRERLHAALMELGMPFTADAVENSQRGRSRRRTAVHHVARHTSWRCGRTISARR